MKHGPRSKGAKKDCANEVHSKLNNHNLIITEYRFSKGKAVGRGFMSGAAGIMNRIRFIDNVASDRAWRTRRTVPFKHFVDELWVFVSVLILCSLKSEFLLCTISFLFLGYINY